MLGFDLKALPTARTSGVGNSSYLTYYSALTIDLGFDVLFEIRVGFTDGLDRVGFGLLGQQGFFENFSVEFRHRERIFTVERS